jgi:ankyrin repeat protein
MVRALLEALADVGQADNDGWTPLIMAAYKGHLEVVHALLEAKADVGHADNDGWAPFFVATCEGHLATVAFLLERGADPLKVSTAPCDGIEAGTAPAEVAETQGHIKVSALLRK